MANKQKIKFTKPILFYPTNVVKKMINELLDECPEYGSISQIIRVAIVRLWREHKGNLKEGNDNGITKPKRYL